MRFVIVTGMSGAGRSTALKMLEDEGFYCVDNLPIPLIEKFAELTIEEAAEIDKAAIGVDIRSGQALPEFAEVLDDLKKHGYEYEILFLDASKETLVKRYKETRRTHPLAGNGRIGEGIDQERVQLAFLKERADYIIDTSHMLTRELKAELDRIFIDNRSFRNIVVNIVSFGFKYGIPQDSDLVFDVRFLPNPYYVDALKHLTGRDEAVKKFIKESPVYNEFMYKFTDMISFLIPHYITEGKHRLVIAVGCTGGRHRSVTLAEELYSRLSGSGVGLTIDHRDIDKE